MREALQLTWQSMAGWLVFFAALFYFGRLVMPDLSWINTGADGAAYMASAKHLLPSHPHGAPLFNMLNALWVRVPYDGVTDAWQLAFLSSVWSSITATVLWVKTRSIIAPLIFAGSTLVVSQSTIIETYALVTMLMVIMYCWRDNQAVVIVTGILGIGVHHLIGLTLLPIIFQYWQDKRSLWPFLWLFAGALWYLWLPLVNRPTYADIWLRGNDLDDYINYFFSQGGLILGLAVVSQDAWIRLQDFSVMFLAALGAALVPIGFRWRNDLLTWCFMLPVLHYALGLPHVAYVYMMPAFAFGGIMVAEGVGIMREKMPSAYYPAVKLAVIAPAVLMIAFNSLAMDIGNTLDEDLTASAFYDDLSEIEANAVVWTYHRGWELVTIRLYNEDTGARIDYILRGYNDLQGAEQAIREAYADGRLYHTTVTDTSRYAVEIERTHPSEIWTDVAKQWYQPDAPPDRADDVDWGNGPVGHRLDSPATP